MKRFIGVLFFLFIGRLIFAVPSCDSYASVTNDWYNSNFSNVYELAQQRMSVNSNDVVAAYLMLEWETAFGTISGVSNAMTRVIELSDIVTNESFSMVYRRVRGRCISYRDEFLPTLSEGQVELERHKSYYPHGLMVNSYMLRLLEDVGL